MSSQRKQIRDAAVVALTGQTTAGGKVEGSAVFPVDGQDLPALRVFTQDETGEYATISRPAQIRRTLILSVECYARVSRRMDDDLDTLSGEVEGLLTNHTLGGLCTGLRWISTTPDLVADAEEPMGVHTIDFEAVYMGREPEPEVLP